VSPAPDPRLTCVGALAGAFGVQGEVRLKSFCADPAAIADYAPLLTEDGRSFGLRIVKPLNGAFAARLTGVTTREAAEALKGTRLYVPRARLPDPGDDEFYHADLIGLDVIDTGGAALGTVRAVLDHGAGDILEIVRPGAPDLMLPFTRANVPTIDLIASRIVADPPAETEARDDGAAP
jgi:16S rRNA processing protein RimM